MINYLIKRIIINIIAIVVSLAKVICGTMLLKLYQTNPKFLFLFSSIFLIIDGFRFLVPFIFDRIEEWNVDRLDKKDTNEIQDGNKI